MDVLVEDLARSQFLFVSVFYSFAEEYFSSCPSLDEARQNVIEVEVVLVLCINLFTEMKSKQNQMASTFIDYFSLFTGHQRGSTKK